MAHADASGDSARWPAKLRSTVGSAKSPSTTVETGSSGSVTRCFWQKLQLLSGVHPQRLGGLTRRSWRSPAELADETARSFGDYDPYALLDFAKGCAARLGLQRAVAELALRIKQQDGVVSGYDLQMLQSDADLEAGTWPRPHLPEDQKSRRHQKPGRRVTDSDTRTQLLKLKLHFLSTVAPMPDEHGTEAPTWAEAAALRSMRLKLLQQQEALLAYRDSQSWREQFAHGVHDFNLNKRHEAATVRVCGGELECSPNAVRDHFASLYFRREGIEEMDTGLLDFCALQELSLSGNKITAVQNTPPGLVSLHCCGNRVREVRPSGLTANLMHLGLAYNELDSLSFLHEAKRSGCVANLSSVDVGYNRIPDLQAACEACDRLPRLQRLYLRGNPCALLPAYRMYLARRMLALKFIDDEEVRTAERRVEVYVPDEKALLMIPAGQFAHHWVLVQVVTVLGGDRYMVDVLPGKVAGMAQIVGERRDVVAQHLRKHIEVERKPVSPDPAKEDPKKKPKGGAPRRSLQVNTPPSAAEETAPEEVESGLEQLSICIETRLLTGLWLNPNQPVVDPAAAAAKGKGAKPPPKGKAKGAAPAAGEEEEKRSYTVRKVQLLSDDSLVGGQEPFATPAVPTDAMQPVDPVDPDAPPSPEPRRGVIAVPHTHSWSLAPSADLADRLRHPWALSLVSIKEERAGPPPEPGEEGERDKEPALSTETQVLGKLFLDLSALRGAAAAAPPAPHRRPEAPEPAAGGGSSAPPSRPETAADPTRPTATPAGVAETPVTLCGARSDAVWVPDLALLRSRRADVARRRALRAAAAAVLVVSCAAELDAAAVRPPLDGERPGTSSTDAGKDAKGKKPAGKGGGKQGAGEPVLDEAQRKAAAQAEAEDKELEQLELEAQQPAPNVQVSFYLYLNSRPQPPKPPTPQAADDKKGKKKK
eukprot:TRINITY_DN7207_c0_g1_i1.p1 TRINITY_DN7207_c0_g1~~TRINITY_DN7207_c0_g1_i1.p1  ORF type:complete len:959 (+),score=310.03 TRINITY_DN7207_c0_g1_i1:79-2877(+)